MQKAIAVLCGCFCVALLVAVFGTPSPKVHHEDSSAFSAALDQAVERLESGTQATMGVTAVMLNATTPAAIASGLQPTFDGRYTCETYDNPGVVTCDPGAPECDEPHTSQPAGHTCEQAYTCNTPTCETYDSQAFTCDPNDQGCTGTGGHTAEPPGSSHTCQQQTCDPGAPTCDQTADPRAPTCDAAALECQNPTFNAFQTTCDPLRPECRNANPGACTAQPTNPTCAGPPECPQPSTQPNASTCEPGNPTCTTSIEETTWGQVKEDFK